MPATPVHGFVMQYYLSDGTPESGPPSALDGIRVTYHYDENGDEWVVRIHHPKGMQSLAGCPGEIEAKMVAAALAAVVSVADVTWSIKSGGNEPEEVECRNLVEFDGMRDASSRAIDLLLDFIA